MGKIRAVFQERKSRGDLSQIARKSLIGSLKRRSFGRLKRQENRRALTHVGLAELRIFKDFETLEKLSLFSDLPGTIDINLQEILQRIHEKSLSETPRPSYQKDIGRIIDQNPLDKSRLIHVITIVSSQFNK